MDAADARADTRLMQGGRGLLGASRGGDASFALAGEWLGPALARRVILIGIVVATLVLLSALGLSVPAATYVMAAAWFAVALLLFAWWRRGTAPGMALRLHLTGHIVDGVAAVLGAHTLGGTLWIAPLILIVSVSLGGQTLPRRIGVWMSLVATALYAAVLAAEVTGGLVATGPFADLGRPDAALAAAAVVMIGVTLLVVSTVHRNFSLHLASVEQRHAQLMATAREMIVTVDARGRYLSMNAAVEAQLGWSASHILGDAVLDSFTEDDRAAAAEVFRGVLGGAVRSAELHVRAADQSPRLLRITGSPIRDENGQVAAAMFVGRDVTDERAQAARLADRERQLRLLVASVNETVFTVDPAFRFTAIYGRWDATLGVGTEAVLGRTLREVLGEGPGGALETPLQRALDGHSVEVETEISRADPPRMVRLSVTPLRDDEGGIVGATGVAYDVSAQRAAERERDALQIRLEEARRTEAIGRLVSGVAHELNNPLAAILSLSEQLRDDRRGSEDAVAIETIVGQAIRSRAIVRDLLSYVRPGGQRRLQPLRLEAVVSDALRPLASHVVLHGVSLRGPRQQEPVWVEGDVSGIEQVVTNLVLNAVQASGTGGTVSVEVVTEGTHGIVRVTDDGPGVPAEDRARVFEPFFTTKPVGQGTGLGLFVSQGIAQQHRGSLQVEDAPSGHGAQFVLRVPLGQPPAAPAQLPGPTTAAVGPADAVVPTILLVDDESAIRMSLRRYFDRRGWAVTEAVDGMEALDAIRAAGAAAFTMIVCDVRMPRMDGSQLHEVLLAEAPAVLDRLIFASGDLASPDMAALVETTQCRIIEKPFELKVLGEVADRLRARDGGSR